MATNLNKLSEGERLQLCRRYFLLGFAFLPILWLVNFIWFYRYTYGKKDENDELQTNNNLIIKEMKRYVLWSGIGTIIWTILITCWIYIYQIERSLGNVYWAELLTYIYPLGYV
ncbi:hypothetical protein ACQ4LE_006039 [Meloidogyne hapla]